MVLAQTLLQRCLCGNVLECCAHPYSTQRRLSGGACGTKPTTPRSRCFRSELLCLNGFASVRRPQSTPSASVQCPPHCTWPGYFFISPSASYTATLTCFIDLSVDTRKIDGAKIDHPIDGATQLTGKIDNGGGRFERSNILTFATQRFCGLADLRRGFKTTVDAVARGQEM